MFNGIGRQTIHIMSGKEYSEESYNELLEKYNTLIKVCKIVMHDIRSPLRFLGDVAESLHIDNLNQPNSTDRRNLELLKETSNNLYYFATNVLDWFINNKLEISLTKESINLSEIAHDIVAIYDTPIKTKSNTLVLDLDDTIWVDSNKEISSIIVRNALDNANKYTSNGEIKITVKKEADHILFSIKDNGKGFDYKKMLQNLNDSNPAVSQHMGFRIIHDLARQVGLSYELNSEKGKGTQFSLKFPYDQPAEA